MKDASTEEMLGLSCYHVVGGTGEDFVYQPTEPPQVPPISVADRIGSVVRPSSHRRRRCRSPHYG